VAGPSIYATPHAGPAPSERSDWSKRCRKRRHPADRTRVLQIAGPIENTSVVHPRNSTRSVRQLRPNRDPFKTRPRRIAWVWAWSRSIVEAHGGQLWATVCEPYGSCRARRDVVIVREPARDVAFHYPANPYGMRPKDRATKVSSRACFWPKLTTSRPCAIARDVTLVVTLFELPAIFARRPACNLAKGHAERARLRVPNRKPDLRNRD
jgi:hypothetical protein